jgi:hypothetical protein
MNLKLSRVASSLIAIAAVIVFAYVYGSATSGKIFMNGSLSLKHEALESDCSVCHEAWEGVKQKACLKCHDDRKHFSDLKVSSSGQDFLKADNLGCPECHKEHGGRSNNLKYAGVSKCSVCHPSGGHMGSKPNRSSKPMDELTILFTHKEHVDYGAFDKDSCDICHKGLNVKTDIAMKNMYKEGCGGCHYLRSHNATTKLDEGCNLCHPGGHIIAAKKKKESLLKSFMYTHSGHTGFKCVDCHESLMTIANIMPDGSPAEKVSDGSTIHQKCVNCHRHKRISISCVSCHQYHV